MLNFFQHLKVVILNDGFFFIYTGLTHYKDLRISIGTDDPGLFSTNLRNEYASIMYTLREMKIVEGTSLINFMSHLAKMSLDSSFIKGT